MSLHGRSGRTYWCLRKGGCSWEGAAYIPGFTDGMRQVDDAKRIAAAQGKSYVVRAVTAIHGESDHYASEFPLDGTNGAPNAITNYSDALLEWQRDYDAEVKAKLIGTLNGYLRMPVTVSQMDLTLIERFPRASIHLHDVLARELRYDSLAADTLLYAADLYLEFSLVGMFRGDYTVSEVRGERVTLRPSLDAQGRDNWTIWSTDSTASGKGFALDRVTLTDLNVRFRDRRSALELQGGERRAAQLRGRRPHVRAGLFHAGGRQ